MKKCDLRSVSVVIPTYNCARLLPQAIASAFAQSVPPLEVVVVNDGCTDDTSETIARLRPGLPDNFVYEEKPNGGEASARNRGVALARGDYVAFLDSDDAWLPDKLERQMPLFERASSPALTFTAYTRVSPPDDEAQSRDATRANATRELVCVPHWEATPEYALRQLLEGCCVTPSTVVVRRDVLNQVGPFDESVGLGTDWEMWLRIATAGHGMEYLPLPLTEYLWHATNMSGDRRKVAQAAHVIFPRLFRSGKLPPSIQRLEKRVWARWNMIRASYCLEAGELREARRYLRAAARIRPASLRPGWVLMYLRALPGLSRRVAPPAMP